MWNFNDMRQILYTSNRSYRIVFDDNTSAVIDFTEYFDKGPVFAPLKDLDFFRKARIEGGTIAWPNGADIALRPFMRSANKLLHSKRNSAPQ
jgi:hypothetical protein